MLNIYIDSTIKAPAKREAKGMYLLEYVNDKDPEKFVTRQGFTEYAETTEDAITLTAIIEALSLLNKPCKIRIFTKARNVFNTLEQRRNETWRQSKCQNSSQNMVKNCELWELLTHILERHEWEITTEGHSYENFMESELKKWQRA